MKLRNILLIVPLIAFKTIYCSHGQDPIDPIQAYLESNLVGNTAEQKQDCCKSAFDHVWAKINCDTKRKQVVLYNICKHADKYQHAVNPEIAQNFFEALKPTLIYRLNKSAIQHYETPESQSEMTVKDGTARRPQSNPFHFSRSERRTKNIAFCCRFFHQKLTETNDFNFDNPNCFSNKENYTALLGQVRAGAVKVDS